VREDEDAVSRDLHAVVHLDEVADQDLALVDEELDAVSNQIDHLPGIGDRVQERELLLLLVVVDRGQQTADQDGDENREALDPGGAAVVHLSDHLHD